MKTRNGNIKSKVPKQDVDLSNVFNKCNDDYLKKVVIFSISCRAICIVFTSLTAFLNPVYDLSQDTRLSLSNIKTQEIVPPKLRHGDILSCFSTWDSHHYLTIAEVGYIYEHQFAFHPMFPFLSKIFGVQQKHIISAHILFIICITISNLCAILSSVSLYKFAKKITGNPSTAAKAAMVFSAQPASNFLSAMYPESLFTLFSFIGMNYLLDDCFVKSSFMFLLSCATKPNAIPYTAFFVWYMFINPKDKLTLKKLTLKISTFFLITFIILSPFILIQLIAYYFSCVSNQHSIPSWCSKRVPSIFFHVQETFWQNGFLRSWHLNNISNILVTLPLIIISLTSFIEYLLADIYNVLGLFVFKKSFVKILNFNLLPIIKDPSIKPTKKNYPFMVYWAFLLFTLCFYMQIQTGIRALIFSPMLHIYIARIHDQKSLSKFKKYFFRIVIYYYIIYSIIASILLGYGYPPI